MSCFDNFTEISFYYLFLFDMMINQYMLMTQKLTY